jgi:hypothetical protein
MYHRYFFTVLQVYINLMSKVTNITITLNLWSMDKNTPKVTILIDSELLDYY